MSNPNPARAYPDPAVTYVALDVHKLSIVAGVLRPGARQAEIVPLENTERAIRRFLRRLGEPEGLVVAYEAGPCGYDLYRMVSQLGATCHVIAPALTPVRPGDRVKTDRRDARKLVRFLRAGELTFVAPPSPEQEGLRDLLRCREDLRRARMNARHRVSKALLRHGRVFRGTKKSWTKAHQAWIPQQRLGDPLAQRALEHMRAHLEGLDAQLAALEGEIAQLAEAEPWAASVRALCCFRGISALSALGLVAEIGDARRFGSARELMSYLGLTPSEYSSGESRHRGHITKAGNVHARRLLVEAAWHYQHPPRAGVRIARAAAAVEPGIAARAWAAQVRLHRRHRELVSHGKRSPVATVAVARELAGFIWAAMSEQPLREEVRAA